MQSDHWCGRWLQKTKQKYYNDKNNNNELNEKEDKTKKINTLIRESNRNAQN